MAALALQDPNQAVRELECCITKLGVMINGYTQLENPDNLIYLDDARMTPFWEALAALDVPLYLYPRASYKAVMYENHSELTGANWGFCSGDCDSRCGLSIAEFSTVSDSQAGTWSSR